MTPKDDEHPQMLVLGQSMDLQIRLPWVKQTGSLRIALRKGRGPPFVSVVSVALFNGKSSEETPETEGGDTGDRLATDWTGLHRGFLVRSGRSKVGTQDDMV